MSLVVVTGANGFVGRGVVARLGRDPAFRVRVAVRREGGLLPEGVEVSLVGDLGPDTDYGPALTDADAVVHCAGRVHVMSDTSSDPLGEYRSVNVDGTANLARQAAEAGVRRFIFLSTVKVNGESTQPGRPFDADDPPAPSDPYGLSKLEAEKELARVSKHTGLDVVVIRPALIYGPGVKANLRSMMGWLRRGVPLPLGAIHNRRSLLALDNLTDLIVTCLRHPDAGGHVFLASDGEDLSTSDLLRRTAAAMGLKARLVPVPPRLLEVGARCVGKAGIARRLCASLQVDIGKTRALLDWTPPVRVDDALRSMTSHFRRQVG